MKILLLYPEFPDTFWSFKHALKFVAKRSASPPLGLLTVAAMLPEAWEKRLVDVNVRKLRQADLEWADLVFISAMTVQRDSAGQLIERCKEAGRTVVAGGPLFTTEQEQFPLVDHFVLHEAELTLPPFLADLERGCPQRTYTSAQYADMQQTPVPRWELLDLKRYASMSVQYSRGCPYHCEFCNVTSLLGHQPRTKSAAQVIAELDALYAMGWRSSIFFVDDNFIGNKRRLKEELLPALIDWQRERRLAFYTEVSINLADDPELVAMMVEAGFDMVFVGIETPDEASLAETNKHHNLRRDVVADIKALQRAGLQVHGGFIVGFDSDPPSIFQRQVEFIQKSGIVGAMVGMLQAPRGTRLYERLQREGRLRGDITGDNLGSSTNIVPTMSLETLREGYHSILRHIYAPKHYYRRMTTFLREYRLPDMRARLDFQHKLAFFRAVFRLGIFSRERLHFWRVVVWTFFTRPRLLPQTVTLAIYGYHFRKVCEKHLFGGSSSRSA